jgi:hypothetical protein
MLVNPREFGRRMHPEFVKETGANVTQVSGAMVQHVFAKGIHDALMERGMSVVTLSEMTGLNYQRLTRMLRGSVLMRIDDIGMIARAVPEAFDSADRSAKPTGARQVTTSTNLRSCQALEPLICQRTPATQATSSNGPDILRRTTAVRHFPSA